MCEREREGGMKKGGYKETVKIALVKMIIFMQLLLMIMVMMITRFAILLYHNSNTLIVKTNITMPTLIQTTDE